MKNKYLILLIVMLSLIISQRSEALSCGDMISQNLTLRADLICDTDEVALYIIADTVTLNLNGFTIRGDGRGKGIQIYDSIGVRITGGEIRRFSTGIFAVRTIGLKINNMEFEKIETAVIILLETI